MTDGAEVMTEVAQCMESEDFVLLVRRYDAGKVSLELFRYMVRNPEAYEVKRTLERMRRDEIGEEDE